MALETLTGKLAYIYDPSGQDAAIAGTKKLVAEADAHVAALKKEGAAGDALNAALAKQEQALASVAAAQQQAAAKADLTRQSMMGLATGLGVVGAASAGFLALGVKSAADFEKKLAETSSLSPVVRANIDSIRTSVLDMSAAMGKNATEAADGLYQAISAGVDPTKVTGFMDAAIKASIGGATQIETAVDGMTTAMNIWKIDAADASKVSDTMFQGVNLGKMTFDELSSSMATAGPIAAAVGVGFEDVTAAAATLTAQGRPASVAMTQIRSSIVAMQSPNEDMQTVLTNLAAKFPEVGRAAEEQGIGMGEAALRTLGYHGAMTAVKDVSKDLGLELVNVTGRVEGANAILGLTGDNASMAAGHLASIRDSAGASENAYSIMAETMAQKSAVFKESVNAAAISVSSGLQPALMGLLSVGQGVVDWFNRSGEGTKTAATALLTFVAVGGTAAAALVGLTAVFGPTIVAAGGLSAAMGILGATASTLLVTLGPIVFALAALAAVYVVVSKGAGDLRKQVDAQTAALATSGGSLEQYSAVIAATEKRATGMAKVVAVLTDELGQADEIRKAETAFLSLELGMSKAALESGEFKKKAAELRAEFLAGNMTAEQHEAALIKLADATQQATDGSRLLTAEEKKKAGEFMLATEATLKLDAATREALAGDDEYQKVVTDVTNAVAKREQTEAQGAATIAAAAQARAAATLAEREAAKATVEAAGATATYSAEFAKLTGAGSQWTADAQAMAEQRTAAEQSARDDSLSILQDLWTGHQKYQSDLAAARAADAAAAASAMAKQGAGSAELAQVEQTHAARTLAAQERLGKAKTDGQRATAQLALDNANRAYAEGIAKETEHQAKLGNVISAGGAGNVARVQAQYDEMVGVQKQALAQMAADYIKSQVLMGDTSEEQAKRIYSALQSAFPGTEVFNPAEQAALGFYSTLHDAAAQGAGTAEVDALVGSVQKIDETMTAADAKNRALVASWGEGDAAMAGSRESMANRIVSSDAAVAASMGITTAELTAQGGRMMEGDEARAAKGEETAARLAGAGAKTAADAQQATTAVGGHMSTMRGQMNLTGVEAQRSGQMTGEAWRGAGTGVAAGAAAASSAAGTLQTAMNSAGTAIAGFGARGSDGLNKMGAAAVEAFAQQGQAAQSATAHARTAAEIYADAAKKSDEGGQQTARAMGTSKKATEDTASATVRGGAQAEAAMRRQKAAVDALAAAYRKLPKTVTVVVAQKGVVEAQKAIQSYNADLMKIPRSITTNIKAVYESGSPPGTDQGHSLKLQHDIEDVYAVADKHGPIVLTGQYNAASVGMELGMNGLGVQKAITDAGAAARGTKLIVTMDAEGDPLILPDGSGKMVWQQLVEDFYDVLAKGPEVDAGWTDLFSKFFDAPETEKGSLAWILTSWDVMDFMDDLAGGANGHSLKSIMDMLEMGDLTGRNNPIRGHLGPLQDMINDPNIANAAERIQAVRDEVQKTNDALMRGDKAEAVKHWKLAYDAAKQLEDDWHKRVTDHLSEQEGMATGDSKGLFGGIKDAEDARHTLAMSHLETQNERVEQMQQTQADFDAARAEALRSAQDAIKSAQRAQQDGEKAVNDSVLAQIEEEIERREKLHDAVRDAIDARKAAEADAHEAAVSALEQQAQLIKAAQEADAARLEAMKLGIDELKRSLDLDGEKAKLDALKTAASEWKSSLGKLERVETDPKKANEAARKAAMERVRLTTDAQKDALRKAMAAGQVSEGDQRTAQMLLLGRDVRARDAERIVASVQAALDKTVGAQQGVIDGKQAELAAAERVLETEERTAAERKRATDAQLKGIDALKTAENGRHKAAADAIDAQTKAEDRRYKLEREAIDELKTAEKKRHDARLKAIEEEYALELLKLGRTPEQIATLLAARHEQARLIAEEATRRYSDALAQVQQAYGDLLGEAATQDAEAQKAAADMFVSILARLREEARKIGGEVGRILEAMLAGLATAPGAGGTTGGAVSGLRAVQGAVGTLSDAFVSNVRRMAASWREFTDGLAGAGAAAAAVTSGVAMAESVLASGASKPAAKRNMHGADDEDFWANNRYGDVRHHYGARQRYLREQQQKAATGGSIVGKKGLSEGTAIVGKKTPFDDLISGAEMAGTKIHAALIAPLNRGLQDAIGLGHDLIGVIGQIPSIPLLPPGGIPISPPGGGDSPFGNRIYNQNAPVNYFNAADAPDEFIHAMLDFVGLGSAP